MRRVPSSPVRAILSAGALAIALTAAPAETGWAQAPQRAPSAPAPAPAPLTDAQVTNFLAAQKDLGTIGENEPEASARAKQDAIARKHGFAGGAELDQVEESIGAVLAGFDEAGRYVGARTMLKRQIDEVKADKAMPAKDRAAALKELNAALADPAPEPAPGDVEVVTKRLKDLQAAMPQGGE